jgi:VIT1/CCC1 family predicted Fe2+/Mn2+ transporter
MEHTHPRHGEVHRGGRAGWLRAAVLGSNDAIVSTASLTIGVAASAASREAILIAGFAGIVAGATSMALGEYVSVSSQRDAEEADTAKEKEELEVDPRAELEELTTIYTKRGLDPDLAAKVAAQLSASDRLGTHLRDELGIHRGTRARPLQAAWISSVGFALFGLVPIAPIAFAAPALRIPLVAVFSLASLTALGALGAHLGGAPLGRAALRVALGGALAMMLSAIIGRILGVAIG